MQIPDVCDNHSISRTMPWKEHLQLEETFSPKIVIFEPPEIGELEGSMDNKDEAGETKTDKLFVLDESGNLKNTEKSPGVKNGVMAVILVSVVENGIKRESMQDFDSTDSKQSTAIDEFKAATVKDKRLFVMAEKEVGVIEIN